MTSWGTSPGFERISAAIDSDDGLRLALMINPDVILLPWRASVLKLLYALIHLRDNRSTPLIVVVADSASPLDELLSDHHILTLEADSLNDEGFRLLAAFCYRQQQNVKPGTA